MAKTQITGRVVDAAGSGVPGLTVEAWDDDLLVDDFLASAETDAEGGFQLEFGKERFREMFLDRTPDVYFRVFRGETRLLDTEGKRTWDPRRPDVPVELRVRESRPPAPAEPQPPSEPERPAEGKTDEAEEPRAPTPRSGAVAVPVILLVPGAFPQPLGLAHAGCCVPFRCC